MSSDYHSLSSLITVSRRQPDFLHWSSQVVCAPCVPCQRRRCPDQARAASRFDNGKGYGFILPDDGSKEIFCHQTDIYAPVR